MTIIDAHAHYGYDEVFDEDFTQVELLQSQEAHGISCTLVQPGLVHDLDTVARYHDAIADLCVRHPGRFAGMANPNPHLPGDQYEREVRRCLQDLGFIGIKLHPLAHAVSPCSRHGQRALALAAALDVPVMVHTGTGMPWSDPSLLDDAAGQFPGLRIVIAHAGGGIYAGVALQLAQRHPNVYLECSWAAGFFLKHCIDALGPERLMFGSDHADNAAVELAKIRNMDLDQGDAQQVLGHTAAAVYGIGRQDIPA